MSFSSCNEKRCSQVKPLCQALPASLVLTADCSTQQASGSQSQTPTGRSSQERCTRAVGMLKHVWVPPSRITSISKSRAAVVGWAGPYSLGLQQCHDSTVNNGNCRSVATLTCGISTQLTEYVLLSAVAARNAEDYNQAQVT